MSESEIFDYLTTVQRMYVEGAPRETVFNYFLQKLLKITHSSLGFIAELLKDNEGKQYFHTLAETRMAHMDKTYVDLTDYHYLLRHDNGYCLMATENNMFGKLIRKKKALIATKNDFKHASYPQGHTPIDTFLGIPFFYENSMVGAIVLCNTDETGGFTEQHINQLKPITYICSILLKGFNNRSLKEIYSKFVDKLHIPIVMFQTQSSCLIDDRVNLSSFYCISSNEAFHKLQIKSNFTTKSLVGETFYESFSNMIDNASIHERIQEMFLSKSSQTLDILDYYDHNIPEDMYTFKFIYIDKQTFALWIERVSEQLKAQKVVDELAKSNEEFFAKIVHEFRNPLNAIINVIALMNESPIVRQNSDAAANLRNKLQILSTSCVTLATLSQDITDYGQLKTKRLKLSYQPFDLSQVIDCAIGMINYDAQSKGIKVHQKIDNNVPLCIVSDPKRLRQILINLCSNAVKFTERGHISITCSLKTIHTDGVYEILFEIEDTGRGISTEEIEKLFKPFTQLRPKTDEFQGTGLGLVICKYLSQLLGGDIWVESEIGRGSHFFFTIKGKRCNNDIIESKYLPLIKGKRCLLGDPKKPSRLAILKSLLNWDVKVTTCDSVDEALLYMDTRDFDVLIVDKTWEKTFHNYPNTIFIGPNVAANKNNKTFLTRPITSENLLQHIVRFVDKSVYQRESSSPTGSPISTKKIKKKPLTILLAEDNYINRQVELESLNLIGFDKVDVAEDGKQAIELMNEFQYDVLLLDLKMPVMDGYQTFVYLLQHPEIKPYTIALTGNAMPRDRERCLNMGMDGYITKPIDMTILKNILNERQRIKNMEES